MDASEGIQFGKAGAGGDIGTVIELQDRGNGSSDLLLSSPLSIEINIDNNNYPGDKIKFTTGSGAKKRVIAILEQNGDLRLRGNVIPNSNL